MKAYEGNENYIFVSYAHADGGTVVPIIEIMQSAGFRVWYDLGIEAGTEWPAYIEDHLDRCSRVIAFISPSAVESFNCRTEINYALMKKKEMLVIYLEETELKYGLSLQLNSIQSLFKYRHMTTKTFYEELTSARILQCCKEGAPSEGFKIPDEPLSGGRTHTQDDLEKALASGDRLRIKASRSSNSPAISTVGTIPSNDPNNHWPTGNYSQIIDEDKFSVIHFHCRFIRQISESGNRELGFMIFDNDDTLVHEDRFDFNFSKGSDRFSIRWIISDAEGLKQKPGDYTVIIWVDDSRIFEYSFRITSSSGLSFGGNNGAGINNGGSTTPTAPIFGAKKEKDNKKSAPTTADEVTKLKDKLTYPKLFRRHLLSSALFLVGAGVIDNAYEDFEAAVGVVLILIALWSYITLWKLSNKHIIKNKVGTAIVMTVGFVYYGIALFFCALWTAINKNKWKIKIAQYESGIIS